MKSFTGAAPLALLLSTTISTFAAKEQKVLSVAGVDGPLHPYLESHSRELLEKYPLIDTHIDLASTVRVLNRRPLDAIPALGVKFPGHFDLPRAEAGGLAGVFLTANAPCPAQIGQDPGPDFLIPTESVQHVLESIDFLQNFISYYPDRMVLARTASDIRQAFRDKKLATLIGMEGTHQFGNSLSVLRTFAQLGVSYVTLTHVCHSSFASSNGGGAGSVSTIKQVHEGAGLTFIGREFVRELNRLGIMVDLSHTSDNTARHAIETSVAPVIWSHSGARSVYNHPRNVPDDILQMIGSAPGQNPGIILSVFFPTFIDPVNSTISRVVDHIEHIASICGKAHVGLGSDYDGISATITGLEDASKWPNIIQELIHRGWTDNEMEGIMGGNLLRVMEEVERVKESLRKQAPSHEIYEKRTDLPAFTWGGPNYAYLAEDVKEKVLKMKHIRDEL